MALLVHGVDTMLVRSGEPDPRIECALRCGLGPWLLDERAADRAFLSPIP